VPPLAPTVALKAAFTSPELTDGQLIVGGGMNVNVTVAVPPEVAEPLKATPGSALPAYDPAAAENVYAPVLALGGASNIEKSPDGTVIVSVPVVVGAGKVAIDDAAIVPERGPATAFRVADRPPGAVRVSGTEAVALVKDSVVAS